MRVAGRLAKEGIVATFKGGKNQCRPAPGGQRNAQWKAGNDDVCCCTWTRIVGWLDISFFLLLSFLSRTSLVDCGVGSLPAWPMGNFGSGESAALGDLSSRELASFKSLLRYLVVYYSFLSSPMWNFTMDHQVYVWWWWLRVCLLSRMNLVRVLFLFEIWSLFNFVSIR